MLWFLLWTVLVLGAGVLFGLLGWSLWRKGLALYRELESAAGQFSAVLQTPPERDSPEPAELGVFADVTEVRRQLSGGHHRPGRPPAS